MATPISCLCDTYRMTDGDARDYALYLRRSNGRRSISKQRAVTVPHIEAAGGRIAAEFTDADRTAFQKPGAAMPERPGFTAMLAWLAAHPGAGIAAWHADRLTRNDQDTAALIQACETSGHLVVTQSGGTYDLSLANGRRRLRDDASAAIYEVDHGRERTLTGLAEVASEGRWQGGKRPFGWEPEPEPVKDGKPWLDDDGKPKKGVLRLRQPEADAIATGSLAILAGMSVGSVRRDWNNRGIRTAEGHLWRDREVKRVLIRPRNAGLLERHGQVAGNASWPAIVDETTWRGVAAILGDPARNSSPGSRVRHLLSFIATCGTCGGPMIASTSPAGRGSRKPVYRCREGARGHLSREASRLEAYVTAVVIAYLSRDDVREVLTRPDDGRRGELVRLGAEKSAVLALAAERNQLHVDGVITTAELVDGRRQLGERLAGIEERISRAAQADILTPLVADPAGVWEGMSVEQRRAVIARLMTITILPAPRGRPAGWRPGQPYSVPGPETVDITWRQ